MPGLGLTPADLFPKEVGGDLPLQAKIMARVSYGRLTEQDLRDLIALGAMDPENNPDQINTVATKGW